MFWFQFPGWFRKVVMAGVLLVSVSALFSPLAGLFHFGAPVQAEESAIEEVPAFKVDSITRKPAGPILQGQSMVVSIKTNQPTSDSLTLSLGNLKTKVFSQGDNTYQGVIGLSIDEKAGTFPLELKDSQGKVLYKESVAIQTKNFGRQNIRVSSGTKGLEPIPGEMEAIGKLKTTMTPTRHWDMPFVSPTPDCENSPFGTRRYHNGTYSGNYHKGVDLRSPAGRPIKAIASGTVQIATLKYRLHGGTVGLDHGQGFTSIYIHMSKLAVKPGDEVKKGQVIGYVGSSGFATGPHLHWGLYANGVPVDPNQWVPYKRC